VKYMNPSFVKGGKVINIEKMSGMNFLNILEEAKPGSIERLKFGKAVNFERTIKMDAVDDKWKKFTEKKETVIVECQIKPMSINGDVSGYLVHISDITERKNAENKLAQAQTLAALGIQAASLAHEIRNPLSSIRLLDAMARKMLGKLKNGEDVDIEKIEGVISKIDAQLAQLEALVEQFLGEAKPFKLQPCLINDVIYETVGLMAPGIAKRKINVSVECDENSPVVMADKFRLKRLLINLIRNSEKALEGRSGEKKITIKTKKENDGTRDVVRVIVEDTGCGIPQEDLGKIFKVLYTTSTDGTGTGIGLPVVKEIAKDHGAGIKVESTVGQGTKFILDFKSDKERISGLMDKLHMSFYRGYFHEIRNKTMGLMSLFNMWIPLHSPEFKGEDKERVEELEQYIGGFNLFMQKFEMLRNFKYIDLSQQKTESLVANVSDLYDFINYTEGDKKAIKDMKTTFVDAGIKEILTEAFDILIDIMGKDSSIDDPEVEKDLNEIKKIFSKIDLSNIYRGFKEHINKTEEVIDRLEEVTRKRRTVIPRNQYERMKKAITQIKHATNMADPIFNVRSLGGEDFQDIRVSKHLKDILAIFMGFNDYFEFNCIEFDAQSDLIIDPILENGVEVNVASTDTLIKTILGGVLSVGVLDLKDGAIYPEVDPIEVEKKKIKVNMRYNSSKREIEISFQSNYYNLYSEKKAVNPIDEDNNVLGLISGLLALCRGKMVIDENDKGTMIKIFLPQSIASEEKRVSSFDPEKSILYSMSKEEPSEKTTIQSQKEHFKENARVVVVAEDEADAREIVRSFLEEII